MVEKIFDFLTDLFDTSTLIIVVLGIVMLRLNDLETTKLIVAGLLGYMAKRK